jgi:hypothetical protein
LEAGAATPNATKIEIVGSQLKTVKTKFLTRWEAMKAEIMVIL